MVTVRRRDLLKGLGASALLPGCYPDPPTGKARSPIEHVIFTMMENRSFDHIFGASLTMDEGRTDIDGPPADYTNPMPDGTPVAMFPTDVMCVPDPPHGWDDSRTQWADGACTGFIEAYADRWGDEVDLTQVMGYLRRAQLPVSYALADYYTLCQRWHASLMTDTWPNRLYAHGAQSQGMTTNEFPDGALYTMATIWDRLDEAGISWSYYYGNLAFISLFDGMANRPEIRPIDQFFTDLASGDLATVVQVEPDFAVNDDHPPANPQYGQVFLSTLHAALAASPLWEKLTWILAYDENGGFADHVSPPKAADDLAAQGFDQLGFRVPSMVIGPYARAAHVSDVQFDHTSWLAFVESLHGLDPLTARDAAATDLWPCHDLDRIARVQPRPPARTPALVFTEAEIADQCMLGARRGAGRAVQAVFDHAIRLGAVKIRR